MYEWLTMTFFWVGRAPSCHGYHPVHAPVLQRTDNYSGFKIYSVTLNVVHGFHTLPNLAVVGVCIFACTRRNTEIFAQTCQIVTYPLDKVIRPLNNWGQEKKPSHSMLSELSHLFQSGLFKSFDKLRYN